MSKDRLSRRGTPSLRKKEKNKIIKASLIEAMTWHDNMMDLVKPGWKLDPAEVRHRNVLVLLEAAHAYLPPYLFIPWFHRHILGEDYALIEQEGIRFPRINVNTADRILKKIIKKLRGVQ